MDGVKNACILLRKKPSFYAVDGVKALLKALSTQGYDMEEIRLLSQDKLAEIGTVLQEVSKTYNNVLLAVEKECLDRVNAILSSWNCVVKEDGSAIYELDGTSLFVCSDDGADTGVVFVKNGIIPYLKRKETGKISSITLRTVGANAVHIGQLIEMVEKTVKNHITCHHVRVHDEDILKIRYDETLAKPLLEELLRTLVEELDGSLYAMEDVSLEEQLVSLLKVRGRRLSVAESFTGGGIAKRITSVSGASAVYFEGLNTYDERSKMHRLGVFPETLKSFGAVSEKTAYEMVAGLLKTGNCDIAVATTGLAGPNSDGSGLPVGLCFIAVGTLEKVRVYQYNFNGSREEITEKAIQYALYLAYKELKKR